MMKRKRREFSIDFKEKVVKEWLEGNKSQRILEKEYDISGSALRRWKNQYLECGREGLKPKELGRPKGTPWLGRKEFTSEEDQLRLENIKLELEIKRLKKADAYLRGNAKYRKEYGRK